MELPFGFAYLSTHHLRAAEVFHVPQCTVSNSNPPKRPSNAEQEKEEQVKPALSTKGFSGARSLSSSHSSNIIILWWTTAVFQHCQLNILNKKLVRICNIALTVNGTHTGTREMTLKIFS